MLSDEDRAILDIERLWFARPGSKEQVVRDRLALNPTRYYQRLSQLIDQPEALAADPVTVGRLRRVRDQRTGVRLTRRV